MRCVSDESPRSVEMHRNVVALADLRFLSWKVENRLVKINATIEVGSRSKSKNILLIFVNIALLQSRLEDPI